MEEVGGTKLGLDSGRHRAAGGRDRKREGEFQYLSLTVYQVSYAVVFVSNSPYLVPDSILAWWDRIVIGNFAPSYEVRGT